MATHVPSRTGQDRGPTRREQPGDTETSSVGAAQPQGRGLGSQGADATSEFRIKYFLSEIKTWEIKGSERSRDGKDVECYAVQQLPQAWQDGLGSVPPSEPARAGQKGLALAPPALLGNQE